MSQENVERTWQAVRSWNEGGVDALLQYLDADVEWLPPRESMEPGVYRGHEGVRDYLGRLAQVFPNASAEPLEVIDVDDERVIAVVRSVARSEHLNKKGIRVEIFTDKPQALKAVGLEE